MKVKNLFLMGLVTLSVVACNGENSPIDNVKDLSKTGTDAAGAGGPGSCGAKGWTEDVKPILTASCTTCHTTGGMAPGNWANYDEVVNAIKGKDLIGRIKKDMPKGTTGLPANKVAIFESWQSGGFQMSGKPCDTTPGGGDTTNPPDDGGSTTPPTDNAYAGARAYYEKNCVGCHNNEDFLAAPFVQGHSKEYLVSQLKAFKANERLDPTMNAFAAMLDEQTIKDIAEHLSTSYECASSVKVTNEVSDEEGKVFTGDIAKGETLSGTCFGCHSGTNTGMFPKIKGQRTQYLFNQLIAFKNDKRTSVNSGMMNGIAKDLSIQDIADLSSFMNAQPRCQ